MSDLFPILAQAPASAPNPLISILMMVLPMLVIMYLLIWKPQQKKDKEHKELIKRTKVGDKVMTVGGIFGTIHAVKDDRFLIKVADKVVIEVSRQSIASNKPSDGQGDSDLQKQS